MTGHSLFRPLRAFGGNGVIDGYVFVEHNLSVNGIVVDRFYLKAQIVIQQDLALAVEQVVVGGGSHTVKAEASGGQFANDRMMLAK